MLKIILNVGLTLGLVMSSVAQATIISYSSTNISGNTWENTYSVSNDTLVSDIEEISIYFDLGLYENLTLATAPAGWDPIAFDPDPLLPDDGLYDVLALASGIAFGDMLSGFSIQFDFLGASAPGSQFFEVLDPLTFTVLDSGYTQLVVTSVPVPGTILLMSVGLIGLIGTRQGHRKLAKLS